MDSTKIMSCKIQLVDYMCALAKISKIPEFCKTFNSPFDELNDFLNSDLANIIIPISWLDKIFELIKTEAEMNQLTSILKMIYPKPLKDPIFYSGYERTNPSRPDYGGLHNNPSYKPPYQRGEQGAYERKI